MIRSVRFLLWAGSILAVLWGMPGCGRGRVEAAPSADHPRVAVAKVARGDVAETLAVTAEFRPYQEIDVHAKVAGYVEVASTWTSAIACRRGSCWRCSRVPELQDEVLQDEAAVEARAGRDQPRPGRSRARRIAARRRALRRAAPRGVLKARPNLVAQQDVDEATGRDRSAEAQVATAKAALVAAEEQLEVAKATAEKTQDARRVLADHGAVHRRHHRALRRHRRDDSGRHLVADADDAARQAVAELARCVW